MFWHFRPFLSLVLSYRLLIVDSYHFHICHIRNSLCPNKARGHSKSIHLIKSRLEAREWHLSIKILVRGDRYLCRWFQPRGIGHSKAAAVPLRERRDIAWIMKITRRDVPTSHIKVIKYTILSLSISLPAWRILSRAFPPAAEVVCFADVRAYTSAHTKAARDQLLYRYWIITQCETVRPRSRVHVHTFYLHPASFPPAFLFPLRSLTFLPRSRLFLRLSLARPACFNAPRIKSPSCVRPCSFIGIWWMATSRSV